MSTAGGPTGSAPAPMRLGEFVPLAAMMISLVALSTDAMLPALPAMGRDLGVQGANDAQLVVSALVLGLAGGQLFYGPLADALGRKSAIQTGFVLFVAGSALCALAGDFHTALLGRLLQGIGAAGPRVITVALVRDQYEGREMARVMSFVMGVFILVPALAPALGQAVELAAGWRAIFTVFIALAVVASAWLALRQPETLPAARRIPFSPRRIGASVREICTTPAAIGHTIATGLVFAPFIGYLSSAQQIMQDLYGTGLLFPLYFASLALAIGAASVVNARLVRRHGMRPISRLAAAGLTAISALHWALAWWAGGALPFAWFMALLALAFFCVGFLFGNLNALAMQPLGHIAGIGAAMVGALSTSISVPIGALIGRAFDGTVLTLLAGFTIGGAAAFATMLGIERLASRRRPLIARTRFRR